MLYSLEAHCDYQHWLREVDKEVVAWLAARPKATPEQFVKLLREIYSRPAMRERFPMDSEAPTASRFFVLNDETWGLHDTQFDKLEPVSRGEPPRCPRCGLVMGLL